MVDEGNNFPACPNGDASVEVAGDVLTIRSRVRRRDVILGAGLLTILLVMILVASKSDGRVEMLVMGLIFWGIFLVLGLNGLMKTATHRYVLSPTAFTVAYRTLLGGIHEVIPAESLRFCFADPEMEEDLQDGIVLGVGQRPELRVMKESAEIRGWMAGLIRKYYGLPGREGWKD